MANYFIIGDDAKEYGPVPETELRRWITENRAGADTKVRTEDATDWHSANRCDYAFNAKLDGVDENRVNPQTVMIFESDSGWDAHGGAELLAAHRHRKDNVIVAFVDGHVETVPAARLDSLRWEP